MPMMPSAISAISTPKPVVTHQIPKTRDGSPKLANASTGTAQSSQKATTPPAIQRPRNNVRPGEPACCVSVMTLIGITGSTQGVRFRISPPKMASSKTTTTLKNPPCGIGMPKNARGALFAAATPPAAAGLPAVVEPFVAVVVGEVFSGFAMVAGPSGVFTASPAAHAPSKTFASNPANNAASSLALLSAPIGTVTRNGSFAGRRHRVSLHAWYRSVMSNVADFASLATTTGTYAITRSPPKTP